MAARTITGWTYRPNTTVFTSASTAIGEAKAKMPTTSEKTIRTQISRRS